MSFGEVLTGLRYLLVGGDALDPTVIRRVLHNYPPQHLLNGYGPTETTTFALTHEIEQVEAQATSIPLGRPIGNTQIYILNDHRQPVPFGVVGEIYIGGDGMALEYLAQPELTAAWFLPDPFSAHPNARFYKTGDLGTGGLTVRLSLWAGMIFRSRSGDSGLNWVKSSRHCWRDGVQSAIVVAQGTDSAVKRLVAHVTQTADFAQNAGSVMTAATLKTALGESLPDYMLPAAYVMLEKCH
ncbi:AMP-binding protein [Vibrio sp. PP-XX7]